VVTRIATEPGEPSQLVARRDQLNAKLRALGAEAERLFGAFRGGDGAEKLASDRLRTIESQSAELRRELAELESLLARARAVRTRLKEVSRVLDGFDRIWKVLVVDERRDLLHLVVEKVTLEPEAGGVRIALHDLGDDPAAAEEAKA
jgi:hypothetical protein